MGDENGQGKKKPRLMEHKSFVNCNKLKMVLFVLLLLLPFLSSIVAHNFIEVGVADRQTLTNTHKDAFKLNENAQHSLVYTHTHTDTNTQKPCSEIRIHKYVKTTRKSTLEIE